MLCDGDKMNLQQPSLTSWFNEATNKTQFVVANREECRKGKGNSI